MQIIVKRRKPCGKYLYLDVEASDTIDAVLARIAEIDGSPIEQFGLYLRLDFPVGKLDEGLFTLSDYFIPDGFTVYLWQRFEITIVMMNGRTFTLEVDAADEIDTVKGWIEDQELIDCDCAQLVVGTTVMDDWKCVLDYGLKACSRVELIMVHPTEPE